MSDKLISIKLDANGKLLDPVVLLETLRAVKGSHVEIDAAETPILTSRHLQILVAGERESRESGYKFVVRNRSEQFDNCLTLLGWQPNT